MSKEAEKLIEDGVASIYRGYFKLRQGGDYQNEYDSMGSLMNMLMKDRQNLREKYKVQD